MARKRTAAWTLLGVATLAAGLFGAWRVSDLGRAASGLERERAAAKAEGLPLEYADIHALTPPVPAAENAAPLYVEAFAEFKRRGELKEIRKDDPTESIADGTATPAQVAAARKALAVVAPTLDKAKEGTRRKGFSLDRDWEKGAALLFPEFAEAKGVVRALVLRAMVATSPAAAADDLRAAARMRRDFGAEPTIIAALVGNALEAIVHRGVRAVGRHGGAWTEAVTPVLNDLGPIPALRRSLAGEIAWGTHFTDELQKYGPEKMLGLENGNSSVTMRLLAFRPVRDANETRVLAYWRKAWRELPPDPTDYRTARKALERLPKEQGASYVMLDILLPVFDGFTAVNAASEAHRRLTREALALWSGKPLKPEKDPFGPGNMVFRRDAKGWLLYSLGPDGNDDGGVSQRDTHGKGYDLVVRGR